jgi:hypothetical protein
VAYILAAKSMDTFDFFKQYPNLKMAVFWVAAPCSQVEGMMEAASTSEMLVNFYQTTWQNNTEDRHLDTCCRENLKSHNIVTPS